MLQALRNDDADAVGTVLQTNPEAATEPFWDDDFEPPLVCAVRLQCKVGIVRLLLEYGASPDVADIYGCTPMQLAQQTNWLISSQLIITFTA